MVKTKHRIINNNFNFDVESYRNFKHKYEPSNICEMPVKWHKAKDFYVFDDNGNKVPMEGEKEVKGKFRFKDGRWEELRRKSRTKHEYGVKLDKEDINEAEKDPGHPLAGKVIKHETSKGGIAYGTVIGVVDEFAALKPFKGSKAPGIYGKAIDAVEESTEEEATQHYSGAAPAPAPAPAAAPASKLVAASFSQKDQLRQLHMLQG